MKTHSVKPADVAKKHWVLFDAENQTLGRLATEVARHLRGKHKPTFTPHLDCGDGVIVINAEKIKLTGWKMDNKLYHNHSLYIGGIKAINAKDLLAKHPERLIEIAVKGMLPKSKLGRAIGGHLRVHAGKDHPHTGLKPVAPQPRLAGGK